MSHLISRRDALSWMSAGVACAALTPSLPAQNPKRPFRIGACDWSIGKRQDIAVFELARRLGLDGVQVSFDDKGARFDLRSESVRREFQAAAEKEKVAIASLAMGILNSVPYSSDPQAEEWVSECVDVMPLLGQKIVLLAFFGKGDIKNKPELQEEVIKRLKKVAPKAERAGVVLGLETWLSGPEHLRILDAVGSPAVKVYYDVANSNHMGYDIYEEIKALGRERICELHCKENGCLLGHGRIDFKKLRSVLEQIDYGGWLIIESAVGKDMSIEESYQHNQRFLRAVFS